MNVFIRYFVVIFAFIDFEGCVIVALLLYSREGCNVLQSACLSVFSLVRLKNHMRKLCKIFYILPVATDRFFHPMTVQYVYTSGFMDDIVFSHNGTNADTGLESVA